MIKILPIDTQRLSEIVDISSQVTSNDVNDPNGLSSQQIFGPLKTNTCCGKKVSGRCSECGKMPMDSAVRSNIRSYIKLNTSIINPVTSSNGEYLGKILNIPFKQVINCEVGLNPDTGVFSEVTANTTNMIFNGEAIRHLIKNFNHVEALRKLITLSISKDVLTGSPDELVYLSKEKTKGSYYLAKGFYISIPDSYIPMVSKRKLKTFETSVELLKKGLMKPTSSLCLLLNFNRKAVENMVMDFVIVTPPGIRPDIDNRRDPQTIQYDKVLNANGLLNQLVANATDKERAAKVFKLYQSLHYLLHTNNNPYNQKSTETGIMESLSGKFGVIRDKMLGKRVDFSGRSVIVVDTNLSIGECAVPFEVLKAIFELHLKAAGVDLNNDSEIRKCLLQRLLPNIPVVLNRAPTLHKSSFLAFFSKISSGNAIGLHPLACEGFNADFDGDQMGLHAPLTLAEIEECKSLLNFTNNMLKPANGEVSVSFRQELLHGLYELSNLPADQQKTDLSPVDAYLGVIGKEVGREYGLLALKYSLPKHLHSKITLPLSKGVLKSILTEMLQNVKEADSYLNRLTQLAYSCATMFSPTITILGLDVRRTRDLFNKFYRELEPFKDAYLKGFMNKDTYILKYKELYNSMSSEFDDTLYNIVDKNNGYVSMVESGARGDISNLKQMFVAKGLIASTTNSEVSFAIESSMLTQLTPLEHFAASKGTRLTLLDKTEKTGETGYAERSLSHSTSQYIITTDDCGTKEGMTLEVTTVANRLPLTASGMLDTKAAINLIVDTAHKRYSMKGKKLSKEEIAKQLSKTGSITYRSPITCKDPVCSKCFGEDLSTSKDAIIGLPVGFITAQSIGEPGTQLSMKTFHSGGIAKESTITSAFDRMDRLIRAVKVTGSSDFYDPIAWATGDINITELSETQITVTIGNSPGRCVLPVGARIKNTVIKGEGISLSEGEHDLSELMLHTNLKSTQTYLLVSLLAIYLGQADINAKYFEVLVLSMSNYRVVDSNTLPVGVTLSSAEMLKYSSDTSNKFKPLILGVGTTSQFTLNPLEHTATSHVNSGVAYMHYIGVPDKLKTPYSRLMVGLPPVSGTNLRGADFIKERNK